MTELPTKHRKESKQATLNFIRARQQMMIGKNIPPIKKRPFN
jgi:hypothetical protein